jgi:hypothetical protein
MKRYAMTMQKDDKKLIHWALDGEANQSETAPEGEARIGRPHPVGVRAAEEGRQGHDEDPDGRSAGFHEERDERNQADTEAEALSKF